MTTTRILAVTVAGLTLAGTGCETMSNTGKGATAGSLIGGAVGTGIGLATGNPRTGAALGVLAGAGIGGAVGAEKDNELAEKKLDRDIAQAQAAEANAPVSRGPLSVAEVMQMSRGDAAGAAKVSDQVIIGYIRSTNSQYNLTPQDLRELTANGVSDPVIQEMMATRNRPAPAPRTVIVREREPRPVVVYERPYYDPWGPPVYYRPYSPPGVTFVGRIR